ncbi:hypothetical protein, conserved [Babesia bigemina]|uniref:Uncharacterized protein n=1 Tax=Babesia bigemina TaxID=5866 RepID=A0A061DDB3_BABBI|nr:hypothetical protein, conserved [Babesia bigemina]CDR97249.1 hypothetical protein, conserved [Babesia bigemina]|eukprot:XP_012769435.1 hypothetical protein, conserved [Babesia bigemina]
MVYTHFGRITKQWCGSTHLRIGSRGQPRPNKGFSVKHFDTVGSALECCRWWKFLRRGTLARILNLQSSSAEASVPGSCQCALLMQLVVTSTHIHNVENGSAKLNDQQLSVLSSYLGVSFQPRKAPRYRRI